MSECLWNYVLIFLNSYSYVFVFLVLFERVEVKFSNRAI